MKSFQEAGISLKNVIANNSSLNLEVNIDNSKKICTLCSLLETTTYEKDGRASRYKSKCSNCSDSFCTNMEDQECYA